METRIVKIRPTPENLTEHVTTLRSLELPLGSFSMAVGGRGARDKSQLIHRTDPRGGWGARVTSGAGKRKMSHFVTRMSGPRLVCSATPQAEIGHFFPGSGFS